MSDTAIRYDFPPDAPAPRPPRFPDLRGEWRIARDSLRLALATPSLRRAPGGRGEPVMLIPGWQAPQASMAPLRRLLLSKGYEARHWGFGINRGNVEGYVTRLAPQLQRWTRTSGNRVALVGWSLGGVIARELARELPDAVSCVITYGSPVLGGPTYSVVGPAYGEAECERIAMLSRERARTQPITCPIAAVFSRGDTIVSWPACIDRDSPAVLHYEVTSTHLSMGIDPSVWHVVLKTLAAYARRAARPAFR
jgi:pimeloyl-ACP methyl ester carboxylesterase